MQLERRKNFTKNIILGTAQQGLNYGFCKNRLFKKKNKIKKILLYARENDIRYLDTAMSYGCSEKNIGMFNSEKTFKIITKLSKLRGTSLKFLESQIKENIYKSLKALNTNQIDILLIHNFEDLKKYGHKLINKLDKLIEWGLIRELGVSVYTPEEALFSLNIRKIKHLNIPFNLIDQRWFKSSFKKKLLSRPDVKIHVRSIFLRGMLLNEGKYWPNWFKNRDKVVINIDTLVKKLKRQNKVDLCLSYVKSFDWIDFIIVGVDSLNHLKEIIKMNKNKKLKFKEVQLIENCFKDVAINSKKILKPYLW